MLRLHLDSLLKTVSCRGRSAVSLFLALAAASSLNSAASASPKAASISTSGATHGHRAPAHKSGKSKLKSNLQSEAPKLDTVPPEPSPFPAARPSDCGSSKAGKMDHSAALSAADILRYGTRKHALGDLAEAEAAFKHVLTIDPKNVDAFFDLGAMAEQRGDYFTALSDYRAALALHPQEKQLKEAVAAMESALTGSGNFQGLPPFALSQPPVLPASVYPGSLAQSSGEAAYRQPISLPVSPGPEPSSSASVASSALSGDPLPYQQDGIFQLSSNRTDLMGTTNASPGANPSLTAGAGLSRPVLPLPTVPTVPNAPAIAPPTVPVAQGGRFRSVAGAVLSTGLNAGLGIGLRASGLHCPVCHMLRFRF